MGEIKIIEDCNAPARFIYLTYSGKNPFDCASKIAGMLQPFFKVSSAGISETDFRWDKTGDPITFYFTWWVEKAGTESPSKMTKMRFNIKVQGSQTKETKEGEFTLQLDGRLMTAFSYNNPFLKGLFWMYDYLFYNKRRAQSLKICEELNNEFRDEIKEHFNLAIIDKGGGI
ncbi:MAG: hypothetical protein KAT35_05090 [Candidatus Aenigmarchaeota archaeon]|nr:hypothetical protein [Candidatus Aenigmarchaeota archaeon]